MATYSSLKTVGELFLDSWKLYKKHMNALALIGVIPLIFEGAKMVLNPSYISMYGYPLMLSILLLVAAAIFALLNIVFNLVMPLALIEGIDDAHRNKPLEASTIYKKAFSEMLQYIFVLMLVIIVTMGGSMLFIIPGIIVSIYLKFSIFAYYLEDKRGMDALVASAWYVSGSFWAVLGREIVLAVALILASLVFMVIASFVVLGLGFGFAVFNMIFLLFVFMILVPFAMVYMYLLYKDIRSIKEAKNADKSFVEESEKIFIILLIVAAVIFLIFFCMATFSPFGLRVYGESFGGGYMMSQRYQQGQTVNYTGAYGNGGRYMIMYRHSSGGNNY